MNFDLTDEQKLLVRTAQRFVRERLGLEAQRAVVAARASTAGRSWAEMAEMGWLALGVPVDDGGLGGMDVDLALLMEELGRGFAASVFAETAILGATVLEHSDLRHELLPRLAEGHCRTSLAHLEPAGRSELDTPVTTRAARRGDGWVLTGSKLRVLEPCEATHLLVTAELDAGGVGTFLVDARAVAPRAYLLHDGTRAADLAFDAVPARLLLPPDRFHVLELAIDRTIVAMSAACVGALDTILAMTASYLKERVQYGQPLGRFQVLQHRMTDMFIETEQARAMVFRGLSTLERGDAAARRQAASGAKWFVGRAALFVAGEGIQLHGGIGITDELAISHYYKAMFVFDQRFGDAAFHLRRSAAVDGDGGATILRA